MIQFLYSQTVISITEYVASTTNGNGLGNKNLLCTIIDMDSGIKLVDAQPMPAIGATGVYRYAWTHGLATLTQDRTFMAIIYNSSDKIFSEFMFRITNWQADLRNHVTSEKTSIINVIDDSDGTIA
jgi:hypothetical protein